MSEGETQLSDELIAEGHPALAERCKKLERQVKEYQTLCTALRSGEVSVVFHYLAPYMLSTRDTSIDAFPKDRQIIIKLPKP
jgi:hypothetical protein